MIRGVLDPVAALAAAGFDDVAIACLLMMPWEAVRDQAAGIRDQGSGVAGSSPAPATTSLAKPGPAGDAVSADPPPSRARRATPDPVAVDGGASVPNDGTPPWVFGPTAGAAESKPAAPGLLGAAAPRVRPGHRAPKFNPATDRAIAAAYRAVASMGGLARAYGTSVPTIRAALVRAGEPIRSKRDAARLNTSKKRGPREGTKPRRNEGVAVGAAIRAPAYRMLPDLISAEELNRLYAGRRYEDVKFKHKGTTPCVW